MLRDLSMGTLWNGLDDSRPKQEKQDIINNCYAEVERICRADPDQCIEVLDSHLFILEKVSEREFH